MDIGKWAFIIGVVIAIVAGFVTIPYIALVLLLLGLVVGFLNISEKECNDFLIAAIALTVGASTAVNAVPAIGTNLTTILTNVVAFVAPAALVVSVKAIINLGKAA